MNTRIDARLRAQRHRDGLSQLIGDLEVCEGMKDALRMRLREMWNACLVAMAEPKELP